LTQGYEIRSYQPEDEEKIVELLQLVFDGWPHFDLACSPIDHWKWKYQSNPHGKSPIILAVKADKIIGSYHSVPQRVKIRENNIIWGDGVDAAVHPDFRKMGIYNKTLESTQELMYQNGFKYWFGATGNPILIRTLSKRYSYFPKPLLILDRIKDIDLHLQKMSVNNSLIKKIGFQIVKTFYNMKNVIVNQNPRAPTSVVGIDSFDHRVNVLWEEVSDQYDFIVERRMDYLNWRFCDLHGGSYIVKQAEDDEHVLGYIVLRVNRYREDYPVGIIVDLVVHPGRPDVVEALVADAIRVFDGEEVNFCRYLGVKNHSYMKVLKRFGFMETGNKVHLFYASPIEENELDKLSSNAVTRIHFTYGDTDWI
jgi:hypothetical protein